MKLLFVLTLVVFIYFSYAQDFANIDSLKLLLKNSREDTARVMVLATMSFNYTFVNADSGMIYGQEGINLANKLNYKEGEAAAMLSYGWALWIFGSYDKAAEFALKSLHLYEDLKNYESVISANNLLTNIYRDAKDYIGALKFSNEAIRIFDSLHFSNKSNLNVTASSETIYTIRATIFLLTGNIDSAGYYMKIDDSKNQPDFIKTNSFPLGVLGMIEVRRGNYEQALVYFKTAMSIAIKIKKIDILDIYNAIAELYLLTGKVDSSIYYGKEVLNKWQYTSYKRAVLFAINILSRCYKIKNMNDSTIKYLELGISLNDSLYNQEKLRSMQNLNFNEQLQKREIETAKAKFQDHVRMYALLAILGVFILIGVILYRNNRQKQKVNLLLTEQKQKVENTLSELKSTQAQLIQSEKMASLGELTAGIAHEIQNPLNFVNNFSEVNRELISELVEEVDKGNTEEVKAIANDIKDNSEKINHHGKRADAIVKGMLQHSRKSEGVKEPTDINALCDEYLRLAYHGLRAKDKDFNATMKTDFDESIGKINIIPQDIGRVLLNLYNNAFYAVTEKASTGSVSASSASGYVPTVSVSTKRINDKVEIRIKDNGNGIPQKVLDKIFQPFFTTKPTGQGTGLGLSLSYDIIKAHGGEIKVETKEGEGSGFTIQLPSK
jgi:two-component system NtrC family sensor kinase